MLNLTRIFLFCAFIFFSCKEKEITPPKVPTIPTIPVENDSSVTLVCDTLSKEPFFGWRDSTIDENKNINAFFFNPVNAKEIIYVANGDMFGYNKLFTYSIPSQKITYLSGSGNYLPKINNRNWLVFSSADFNIYKVKTNGDSLRQLTGENMFHNPHWDYTGKFIYFFQSAYNIQPARFVKTDIKGNPIDYLPAEFPVMTMCKKKNGMAYLKNNVNNYISVYYRDLAKNSETLLLTSESVSASSPELTFNHLTFDNNDENLYWSNDKGIFMYNIAEKKITQLYANCKTLTYNRPMVTINSDKLTYTCHIIKQLDYQTLFHFYKTFQMDIKTQAVKEISVLP